MKHLTLNELELHGDVLRTQDEVTARRAEPLSRRERLERWACLLEAHTQPVNPFYALESLPRRERWNVRSDGTPLAVAFADPVLRADGLEGDTIGDAMRFFELSDRQMHRLFCDCHYHGRMTAPGIAEHLRSIAARKPIGETVRDLWRAAFRSN
jgi:hypothetical protein